MRLLEPIDNYCERTTPELFSEPLNAISNAAFFLAAYLLWRHRRAGSAPDRPSLVLICLLALIGLGSTLFHTFANGLTMLGDIIPISAFTFTYLWFALRILLGYSRGLSAGLLLAFTVAGVLAPSAPQALQFNGSVAYFPCLAALLLIGAALLKKNRVAGVKIVKAACLFIASLTLRSVDMALCETLPHGTHFLWHVMNGAVLFLLVHAVMPHKKKASADY